jgi:hypothetical protein
LPKIPYTVVVGCKDMPVDLYLGIPDMSKLLNESSTRLISRVSLNQRDTMGKNLQMYTFYRSSVETY